jgi:two-component system nitrogen regulation response regulator GlnG
MAGKEKVLVVDDEENIRWIFKKALEKKGFEVHAVADAEEAFNKITSTDYLLVFSDIFLGGMSGIELLEKVNSIKPNQRMVVMTAQDTMNNAIEAMRKGALDYISKPFDFEEIYSLLEKATQGQTENIDPEEDKNSDDLTDDVIVGKSKEMQNVFKTIGRSASSDLAILITGESGTGKEMVARAVHNYSNRVEKPLISINCAAISRELLESELFGHEKGAFTGATETKSGKFELAQGGTLFLDEIGDMEIQLQAKILRVLQNSEFYRVGGKYPVKVDVRIVAATNHNLETLMENNLFREDLFHRLNVIHIALPPLRDRREDIPLLAQRFLTQFSSNSSIKNSLAPDTLKILERYDWRGNIRELENTIRRGMTLAAYGVILPEHLPNHILETRPFSEEGRAEKKFEEVVTEFLKEHGDEDNLLEKAVRILEKYLFQKILKKFSGKQVAAAQVLGINRNTLKRKLDSMNIDPKEEKKNDENE